MAERAELLQKLVESGHVDVFERQALGKVDRNEVGELVKSVVCLHGAFPKLISGRAVYEGARLVRLETGASITWERAYPWDPFTVAERRIESFETLDAAIERFIDSEWKSGIDGIPFA